MLITLLLTVVLGSGPVYGKTPSVENGYLRADDIEQTPGYGSSYQLSDGTIVDIEWVKVGSGNVGFTGRELDSGEQTLIMPTGFKMTYWFVIDNGFREIRTPAQQVVPLYIEYKNENAARPSEQFLYKKNPAAAANTICYNMPQDFDYAELGNWIISVKRVIRVTSTTTDAEYESAEREVYLTNENGNASIIDWSPQVYRVAKGDTLWNIADSLCGSPDRWKELYRPNQSVIQNPDKIYAGQMIVLPPETLLPAE